LLRKYGIINTETRALIKPLQLKSEDNQMKKNKARKCSNELHKNTKKLSLRGVSHPKKYRFALFASLFLGWLTG